MKVAIVMNQMPGDRWRVYSPSLPGCIVEGPTMENAQTEMGTAVAGYISSLDAALPSRIELVHQRGSGKGLAGKAQEHEASRRNAM